MIGRNAKRALNQARGQAAPRGWRPVLELLEDRLAPANLVLQGPNDAAPDAIELSRAGSDLQVVINGGAPTLHDFSSFDDIVVVGNDEGTKLIVDNGGGLINRLIDFQAQNVFPLDILVIEGNAGAIASETYTTGASQGNGTIVFDPDGTASNGDEETITFSGVIRVDDTKSAVNTLNIQLTSGNDFVNIVNGNVVNGFNTTWVNSGNGLFTSIQLANKATVNVNGRDGADTFTLNNTTPGTGLTNLNVWGNDSTGVETDDNAAETINIQATAAGVTTTVHGEGGDDLMQVSNAGTLDSILGNLDLQAGGGTANSLNVSDATDPDADTNVVITSSQITGLAPAIISYSTTGEFSSVNIFGGSNNDTFNVRSTLAGSDFTQVNAGGGNDIINVSSDAPANAGTLDNILGFLLVRGGGGTNQLNVSDAGDADADVNVVLESIGSGAQITGLAPATIAYEDLAGTFGNGIFVTGGTAGDTFQVRSTLANAPLTVDGGGGGDTFHLGNVSNSLDNLVASSPVTILGGAGSNTLNVNDQGDTDSKFVTVTNATIAGVAPVTINYSATGTFGGGINLNCSQGTSTYLIQSTLAGGTTTVATQDGDDIFNVTNNGTLDDIAGNLAIQAGGGTQNNLILSDSADPDADSNVVITSSQISGLAPALISYSTTGSFINVQLTAGMNNDVFSILSTSAAVSGMIVDGDDGNDTFNVSSNAPTNTGNLDGIAGLLELRGGNGANTIVISDQNSSTANASVVVNDFSVVGLAGPTDGVLIAFSTIGTLDLTIRGSDNADDSFHIEAMDSNVTLAVHTGAGDDTVDVGNAANSLDDIVGPLAVLLGAGASDSLTVNDQGDGDLHTYSISAALVSRTGAALITYTGAEAVAANTGSNNNSIAITATSAATTVNAGTGDDAFAVSSSGFLPGGVVALIQHAVTLNGGGGSNTLLVNNAGDVANNDAVHVSDTQVGADPTDHFFGPGGSLTHSGMTSLTLDLANAVVGDVIRVVPSASTEFFINAGLPVPPTSTGDVLLVDTTGTTNPVQGSGIWTFDDRESVNFTGIEADQINEIIVVAEGRNRQGRVEVYDALTRQLQFTLQPFGNFKGSINVAAGDVTGDGVPDIIAGKGVGSRPQVRVFDGITGLPVGGPFSDLLAFGAGFRGGVFVAAGDLNQDGYAEVIVGQGALPISGAGRGSSTSPSGPATQVRIFDGATGLLLDTIAPFGNRSRGARVAAGDVTGDGRVDIIVGAARGKPLVRVFDGATFERLPGNQGNFVAFGGSAGVFVAAGDLDGDGLAEIIVSSSRSRVAKVFSGQDGTLLNQVTVAGTVGLRVAAADATGAQRSDLLVTRLTKSGEVLVLDGESLELLDSFFALTGSPGGLAIAGS